MTLSLEYDAGIKKNKQICVSIKQEHGTCGLFTIGLLMCCVHSFRGLSDLHCLYIATMFALVATSIVETNRIYVQLYILDYKRQFSP
jgi:hypothetical protein